MPKTSIPSSLQREEEKLIHRQTTEDIERTEEDKTIILKTKNNNNANTGVITHQLHQVEVVGGSP